MEEKPKGNIDKQEIAETQESPLAIERKMNKASIGIPKENSNIEKRVALSPDSVSVLVKNGFEVLLEKDAGVEANFSTEQYREAGAEIVFSPAEVFGAQIVLKISPPTLAELDFMKVESTLISALQFQEQSKTYFEKILNKRITAIAFESMEDAAGNLPVIRAMSEIAGSSSILIAAEYLSKGRGTLLGGIAGVPPTSVVIIGAGTVAEFAARTALGLGAEIKVFDLHLYRLQRLRYSLGQSVFTSIIDSDKLSKALSEADVVVAALRAEKTYTPLVVTEEMVENMKDNAVIVDVAIDQGPCIATSRMTSHQDPIFKKHGVVHYAVPNIASRVGNTASCSLSNIFTPVLIKAGNMGGINEMILGNEWFIKGVYAFKGNITHQHIAKKHMLRHRDLSLLLAARI